MELAVEESHQSKVARVGDPRVGAVVARKSAANRPLSLQKGIVPETRKLVPQFTPKWQR